MTALTIIVITWICCWLVIVAFIFHLLQLTATSQVPEYRLYGYLLVYGGVSNEQQTISHSISDITYNDNFNLGYFIQNISSVGTLNERVPQPATGSLIFTSSFLCFSLVDSSPFFFMCCYCRGLMVVGSIFCDERW